MSPLAFPTVYQQSRKAAPLEWNPNLGINSLEMRKYDPFPRDLQLHCTLLLKQFQDFISGIAVNMSEKADKVLDEKSRKCWMNIAVHLIQRTAEKELQVV